MKATIRRRRKHGGKVREKLQAEPKVKTRKRRRRSAAHQAELDLAKGAGILLPLTTEDGMTWLDAKGKPPSIDDQGKLREPFDLRLVFGDGSSRGTERWMPGLKLPLTPKAHSVWAAGVEAERKAKEKGRPRESSNGHEPTPLTVSGKKQRKRSDEGLTEEQQAKRDKRRARREARKRRKGGA